MIENTYTISWRFSDGTVYADTFMSIAQAGEMLEKYGILTNDLIDNVYLVDNKYGVRFQIVEIDYL